MSPKDIVDSHYHSDDYYEVGREKIREFARAVQNFHPAHWDDAAAHALGYRGLIAPPTFASSVASLAQRAMFREAIAGYDPSQLLHLEQELHLHRPVVAGDRLTADLAVESLRRAETGDIIVVTTVFSDHRGAPVQTAHTTLVARRGPAADNAVRAAEALAMQNLAAPVPEPRKITRPLSSPQPKPAAPDPATRTPLELAAGQRLPARSYRLTRGEVVNYAGVSGDNNPIHWSDDVSRRAGLDSVVAHGMLTMGLAAGYLTEWLDDPSRVLEYTVRFTNLTYVDPDGPTELELTGRVRSVDSAAGTAVVALTAESNGADVFGHATARIRL
ncbi:fused (3R)-hydroxyacyl-ACP dehydratase subunits HadA/HadB [Nocardia sp. NPDC051787]|uniref:fused (3R)-hydroxyacyl-ACP dehydratase subunits HadA/HadB n=1 Tax=Nocardia sp. NPDC051787 TaxID=3155415 RepID=UPI00343B81A7